MKYRLFIVCALLLQLTGCGNPSVIAFTRGMVFEQQGDKHWRDEDPITQTGKNCYVQAIDQFSAAIHLQPQYTQAFYHRGLCNWRMGEYEDAFQDLSEAIALAPHNAAFWKLRAYVSRELCQYEKAVQDYNQALLLQQQDSEALQQRAECYELLGQLPLALRDLDAVSKSGKEDSEVIADRASVYRRMKAFAQMEHEYERALHVASDPFSIMQRRGYSRFIIGNFDGAYNDLTNVIKDSDWQYRSTSYSVILAALCCKINRDKPAMNNLLEEAIYHYKLAIKRDDSDTKTEMAKDWPLPAIQYLHGDISAERLLAAAGSSNEKLTEANCYIGLSEEAEGHAAAALSRYEWIKKSGDRNFVEYDLACARLEKKFPQKSNLVKR